MYRIKEGITTDTVYVKTNIWDLLIFYANSFDRLVKWTNS